MIELYFNLGILVLGIVLLIRSGVYVVHSIDFLARYLHFSKFVLSFILLALATSLPELTVGISSALKGIPELALGDILGTNIVNLTLILGFIAVLGGGKLGSKDYKHFNEGKVFMFLFILAPILLVFDGTLSRIDGFLLLILFAFNFIRLVRDGNIVQEETKLIYSLDHKSKKSVGTRQDFIKNVFKFSASTSVLLFSAYLMITSATNISLIVGVPEFLIGLFIIAVGTSLPEFSVGIRGVLSGNEGVSLGNLFGSSVLNSTLILGIVALLHPISIPVYPLIVSIAFFTLFTMLLIYLFLRKKNFLLRKEGFILLGIYASFLIFQFFILATQYKYMF